MVVLIVVVVAVAVRPLGECGGEAYPFGSVGLIFDAEQVSTYARPIGGEQNSMAGVGKGTVKGAGVVVFVVYGVFVALLGAANGGKPIIYGAPMVVIRDCGHCILEY